ncbi:MAG: 50S ribosomal protein L24 [Candidatus Aenigmarchaeota archaeon]|nr:50S ribosomal protein L24 [Candidatus Aenigmarchaeota archaeon]
MKKAWSNKWVSSTQPRKQRKYVYNAPLHIRQKFVSAHLSEALRNRFGKRSLPIRKGDEVKIMRGSNAGHKGKVDRVDLKHSKIYIEGHTVKKVDGSEIMKSVHPSNILLVDPKMDDKRRQMIVERSRPNNKAEKTKAVKDTDKAKGE